MASKTKSIGEYIAESLPLMNSDAEYIGLGTQGAKLLYTTKGVAATIDFINDARKIVRTTYTNPEMLAENLSIDCAIFVNKYANRQNVSLTVANVFDNQNVTQ
jgi:hypothetical protein